MTVLLQEVLVPDAVEEAGSHSSSLPIASPDDLTDEGQVDIEKVRLSQKLQYCAAVCCLLSSCKGCTRNMCLTVEEGHTLKVHVPFVCAHCVRRFCHLMFSFLPKFQSHPLKADCGLVFAHEQCLLCPDGSRHQAQENTC